MKVLIIGGGASGMMAALSAARDPRNRVILLERQSRVGKKLLATGNGRCNLTNIHADASHYHGQNADFVIPALEKFGVEKTLDFFHELGLLTVMEDDGKVYPLSDHAASVVDVLRFALEEYGVQVECSCEVTSVRKKARGWQADCADGRGFFADKLIIAAGGAACKKLGATEDGYRFLTSLGHHCTELSPSLVQIKTKPDEVRALKGIRADANVILKIGGSKISQYAGQVQFTEFGVSGPVGFSLSRFVSDSDGEKVLLLDFMRSYDDVFSLLQKKRAAFAHLPVQSLLAGMLHSRLANVILARAGLDKNMLIGELDDAALTNVAKTVKCFSLPVIGLMGLDQAQVTAGGILTSEFVPQSLESRLAEGVFATGEVLDVDGDCGGYNLQWAWTSGYVAGLLGNEERL